MGTTTLFHKHLHLKGDRDEEWENIKEDPYVVEVIIICQVKPIKQHLARKRSSCWRVPFFLETHCIVCKISTPNCDISRSATPTLSIKRDTTCL
jgi:hypothetical protein